MLRSFDFIDPNLAKKIKSLEQQQTIIKQKTTQIENNRTITSNTKEKLITYHQQCLSNISSLLHKQKNKMAQYLDNQMTVITKENKERQFAQKELNKTHDGKINSFLNQSTKIDVNTSYGDSQKTKSIEASTCRPRCKIQSFQFQQSSRSNIQIPEYNGNIRENKTSIKRSKLKRMSNKISKQKKTIDMLISWIKLYYERQQENDAFHIENYRETNKQLSEENQSLKHKCQTLSTQLENLHNRYLQKSKQILEDHKKTDNLRQQNKELKMERDLKLRTIDKNLLK